jgi:Xaa-Pro aminopeptidase
MQQTEKQRKFHKANRQKLRSMVHASEPDCRIIIITANSFIQASADKAYPFEQDSNFFYLTGINEAAVLLVMDDDNEYLIVPERDPVREAFEGAVDPASLSNASGIHAVLSEKEGWEKLGRSLKSVSKIATLSQSENYIKQVDMFTNPSRGRLIERLNDSNHALEVIDLRKQLTSMRMVKSPFEINMLESAIDSTIKIFEKIEDIRGNAKTERDIFAEVAGMSVRLGAQYAYEPIIASGINAVTLHYIKNDAPLDKNSLLLLDIGLKDYGYSADITRTVSYDPTKRQQAVYEAVLAVQEYAISLLKPGVSIREYEGKVHERMGEKLIELGLIKEASKESIRQYYPHSTSHFLGIDVHDVGDYERPLEAGVVLTVEPGIYVRDEAIGIRIEDDILITSDGNKNLTQALPKNLASLTIKP